MKKNRVSNFEKDNSERLLVASLPPSSFEHYLPLLGVQGVQSFEDAAMISQNRAKLLQNIPAISVNRAEARATLDYNEECLRQLIIFYSDYFEYCQKIGFKDGYGKLKFHVVEK